jgi:hypothetical protein
MLAQIPIFLVKAAVLLLTKPYLQIYAMPEVTTERTYSVDATDIIVDASECSDI